MTLHVKWTPSSPSHTPLDFLPPYGACRLIQGLKIRAQYDRSLKAAKVSGDYEARKDDFSKQQLLYKHQIRRGLASLSGIFVIGIIVLLVNDFIHKRKLKAAAQHKNYPEMRRQIRSHFLPLGSLINGELNKRHPSTDTIKLYLNEGATIPRVNTSKRTNHLDKCLDEKNYELAQILIRGGYSIEHLNSECYFDTLIRTNQKDIIDALLDRGAKLNSHDAKGSLPLISALYTQEGLISYLIEKGADLNGADLNGNTALHHAVSEGKIDVVKQLLTLGAVGTKPNHDGYTPLDIALAAQNKEIIDLLTANQAPIYLDPAIAGLSLYHSVLLGDETLVQRLIQAGADPKAVSGKPLLMKAYELANLPIVKILLTNGADPNIEYKHQRLIDIVTTNDDRDTLLALIDHGLKVNVPLADGRTLVDHACAQDDIELLVKLKAKGAGFNRRHPITGQPPLHQAVISGKEDLAKALLGLGAKLNQVNYCGDTPLITTSNLKMRKFLLSYIHPNLPEEKLNQIAQTGFGTIDFQIRYSENSKETAQLLRNRNLSFDANFNPIMHALAYNKRNLLKELYRISPRDYMVWLDFVPKEYNEPREILARERLKETLKPYQITLNAKHYETTPTKSQLSQNPESELHDLIKLFDGINTTDPNAAGYEKPDKVKELRPYIIKMIGLIDLGCKDQLQQEEARRTNHLAVPTDPVAKRTWYTHRNLEVRNLNDRYKAESADHRTRHLIALGELAQRCGTGWVGAIDVALMETALAPERLDLQLINWLHDMRVGILNSRCEEQHSEANASPESYEAKRLMYAHWWRWYMTKVGKSCGIYPPTIFDKDMYIEPKWDQLLPQETAYFNQKYKPQAIILALFEEINSPESPISKEFLKHTFRDYHLEDDTCISGLKIENVPDYFKTPDVDDLKSTLLSRMPTDKLVADYWVDLTESKDYDELLIPNDLKELEGIEDQQKREARKQELINIHITNIYNTFRLRAYKEACYDKQTDTYSPVAALHLLNLVQALTIA